MIEKILRLTDEFVRLNERLQLLNVQSIGRDRIVQRIEMIDQELKLLQGS